MEMHLRIGDAKAMGKVTKQMENCLIIPQNNWPTAMHVAFSGVSCRANRTVTLLCVQYSVTVGQCIHKRIMLQFMRNSHIHVLCRGEVMRQPTELNPEFNYRISCNGTCKCIG